MKIVLMLKRSIRFNSSVVKKSVTGLTRPELQNNPLIEQAPNRAEPWAPSQQSRLDVISKFAYRFIQKDLSQQPRPYSAMELIAKQPIRYVHDSIAVCDGNKGSTLQGHPKIFINLDKPEPSTCGYCGLRYAKEEHKHLIEKD